MANNDDYLVEGRLLFQRMLTLNVDKRHAEATAEQFQVTDVRIIMTALTCATAAMAKMIHGVFPDPAQRAAYLEHAMLSIDDIA